MANTAIEQQQYQMFNNNSEDINYYSSSGIANNDNEIIMDDPMNINSKYNSFIFFLYILNLFK